MRNFRLIISTAVAVSAIAGIGAASAADLPARTYTKAPAMVVDPVYNWTGFYIGGTLGGAWTNDKISLNAANGPPNPNFLNIPATNAFGSTALRGTIFTASAKAGYNWQAQSWIFGVEGDIASLRFRRSTTYTGNPDFGGACAVCFQTYSDGVKSDWVATIRPRVGYAVDRWMVYGTGGLAVGNLGFTNAYQDESPNAPLAPPAPLRLGNAAGAVSATRTGWAAGAGAEYAVTKNWLFSLEYMHIDLGTLSVTETLVSTANTGGTLNFSSRLTSDMVRGGAAYKF